MQGSEKMVKPSDALPLEVVGNSVSPQFPALIPVLYPGELMTAVEPLVSLSAMWQAHDVYVTNNTPFCVVPTGIGTCSAGAFAQSFRTNQHGTQRDAYAMHVTPPPDVGPFIMGYNHLLLQHFDEVYIVSPTFVTTDPPLCSSILSLSER